MFSVCDACCLLLYVGLLSTRILGLTLVSSVFHVTVEPQTEEEQYEVAEHNYEEEQDQGQYSEQGKPPHQYNESYYFYQACFVLKNKIMHVLLPLWHLATRKLFYKILFGQSYLLEYYRCYTKSLFGEPCC